MKTRRVTSESSTSQANGFGGAKRIADSLNYDCFACIVEPDDTFDAEKCGAPKRKNRFEKISQAVPFDALVRRDQARLNSSVFNTDFVMVVFFVIVMIVNMVFAHIRVGAIGNRQIGLRGQPEQIGD